MSFRQPASLRRRNLPGNCERTKLLAIDRPALHDRPTRGSPTLTRDQGEGDQPTHPPIPGDVVSASGQQRTCSYTGRGICSIHGPGAKRFWRPQTERVTSPDGEATLRTVRKYYYSCDLGPRDGSFEAVKDINLPCQ